MDLGLWVQAERKNKMRISLFFIKFKYLGQKIDRNNRRLDPAQTSAIKDISASKMSAPYKVSRFWQIITTYIITNYQNKHALLANFVKHANKKLLNGFRRQNTKKHLKNIEELQLLDLFLTHSKKKKKNNRSK